MKNGKKGTGGLEGTKGDERPSSTSFRSWAFSFSESTKKSFSIPTSSLNLSMFFSPEAAGRDAACPLSEGGVESADLAGPVLLKTRSKFCLVSFFADKLDCTFKSVSNI